MASLILTSELEGRAMKLKSEKCKKKTLLLGYKEDPEEFQREKMN